VDVDVHKISASIKNNLMRINFNMVSILNVR